MPGAKERKPGKNTPRATIVAWLRKNWSEAMIGAASCDRCQARTHLYPCGTCPHWDLLVESYRRGDI